MTKNRLAPTLLLLATLPLLGAAPGPAAADTKPPGLEIRFYPDRELRLHELNGQRGVWSALLQNVAVVNRGAAPVTLDEIALELTAAGESVQTNRLTKAALDAVAARSGRLAASGMVDLFAFQFQSAKLLAGAKPVGTLALAPGEALLIGQRVLALQNAAIDRLRVTAHGHDAAGATVEGSAELPIKAGGSANSYLFPLAGNWFIGAGASLHSHHRWVVPEEFALDIGRLGESGTTHRGTGSTNGDYYDWEQPVRAAADGTVVAAVDEFTDSDEYLQRPGESTEAYNARVQQQQGALLQQGLKAIGGNVVSIQHANGEYSHYCHLRRGSVTVKVGDVVKRGQPIAKLGNTGNSTEPHLHFEVTDGPDALFSVGIPVAFEGIEILWADAPRALQTGDVVEAK